MNNKRFVIAYGNRDREDDGAGWHILDRVLKDYGLQTPEFPGEWVETLDGTLRFLYLFQLLPEMAEDILPYDEIIFIDAHNSEQLPDLLFESIAPSSEHSAFTHHLSAGELLAICKTMTGSCPPARLMTIRGFSFRFKQELSEKTESLVMQAADLLREALKKGLDEDDEFFATKPYKELAVKFYKISNGWLEDSQKAVIKEHSLALIVNNELWMTFICSPTQLKEQAIGFLYNEGIISGLEDVESVKLADDPSSIEIRLKKAVEKPHSFHRTSTSLQPIQSNLSEGSSEPAFFQKQDLTNLYQRFTQKQLLHDLAGGFHSAGLSDGLSSPIIVEDLGRHNCVDKLAGAWLLGSYKFSPTIMLLSGRISSEMVMKSLAMGIRLIISRTTPTTRAIELADKLGICLIGYMRANQYEVYSHPEYLI